MASSLKTKQQFIELRADNESLAKIAKKLKVSKTTLINVAQANIKVANIELERLKNALPTREQFYELTRSYLKTINETQDLLELDAVLNEVVLNLRAGDNSVSVIKLNPPYNMLVDLGKISTGRGDRI